MANNYFQFKKFTVRQDKCAMKVSTDACIQGAWAARYFSKHTIQHVLDIGTGTGLLSLMLAQQLSTAAISAIEINEQACEQARENFNLSPWHNRLDAQHSSLQNFMLGNEGKYDVIICNPPFFHNQLQSAQKERNDARHSVSLDKEQLAIGVSTLLTREGSCCVLYPESEWNDWLRVAKKYGLFAEAILKIKPKLNTPPNRVIGIFSKQKQTVTESEFIIYHAEKNYTAQFIELMQSYYLNL